MGKNRLTFEEFLLELRKKGYAIVAMNEYSDSEGTLCLYVVVKEIGGNLCAKSEGFDYGSVFERVIEGVDILDKKVDGEK